MAGDQASLHALSTADVLDVQKSWKQPPAIFWQAGAKSPPLGGTQGAVEPWLPLPRPAKCLMMVGHSPWPMASVHYILP